MEDLIERLEAAGCGSYELDRDVLAWSVENGCGYKGGPVPLFSDSLDAALALAERVLEGWPCWGVATDIPDRFGAVLAKSNRDEGVTGYAPTPALALCIAILRAKMENEK